MFGLAFYSYYRLKGVFSKRQTFCHSHDWCFVQKLVTQATSGLPVPLCPSDRSGKASKKTGSGNHLSIDTEKFRASSAVVVRSNTGSDVISLSAIFTIVWRHRSVAQLYRRTANLSQEHRLPLRRECLEQASVDSNLARRPVCQLR